MNLPIRSECKCSCHTQPGVMHCFPCCRPDPVVTSTKEPTTMTTTTDTTPSHTAVASIPLPAEAPTIENPLVVPREWAVVNVADGRVWIRRVVG